jgi:hypothetical protein
MACRTGRYPVCCRPASPGSSCPCRGPAAPAAAGISPRTRNHHHAGRSSLGGSPWARGRNRFLRRGSVASRSVGHVVHPGSWRRAGARAAPQPAPRSTRAWESCAARWRAAGAAGAKGRRLTMWRRWAAAGPGATASAAGGPARPAGPPRKVAAASTVGASLGPTAAGRGAAAAATATAAAAWTST